MRYSLIAAAACALATPAGAKTFSYDCDTTADRASEIATAIAPGGVVSGRVSPRVIAPGRTHLSIATIWINGEGGSAVGFKLYAGARDATDSVIVSMITLPGGQGDETVIRTLKIKEAVRFRLALGKDGLVSLELDDWKGSAKLAAGASPTVSLGCSTGEFQFEDVDFGG